MSNAETEIRTNLPDLYPRLWRFALVLSGTRDAADDLAQTTAIRAMEKAQHYTPGTRLDSWLFTMARRIWLNELRARAVRRGQGLMAVEDIDLPDPSPGQEVNRMASEVLAVVNTLPEAQREAVLLVYVEEYTCAEAATMLDVPMGTVLSRLSTARRKINGTLAPKESAAE
ncbi:MAG: RNA polymerase sigma factor [Pseudomonadota bacterium]